MNITLKQLRNQNSKLTKDNLFEAYKRIVKRIRLDLVFLPIKLSNGETNSGFELDGFKDTLLTINNVEVACKEVQELHGVDEDETFNDSFINTNVAVGDISKTDYGFSNFENVNNEHTTVPSIHRKSTTFICTNIDEMEGTDVFFWISGYFYPHFVYEGEVIENTYYDFSEIDDEEVVIVDPALMFSVTMEALAIAERDVGNIEVSINYKRLADSYVKIYNRNLMPQYANRYSPIGSLQCPDI